MTSDLNLDWLISVDDHILEPPNVWVDRVAAKDRERPPTWRPSTGWTTGSTTATVTPAPV